MLTVYGDFNCPYSRLASKRVDELIARGEDVTWRAVQHAAEMPAEGVPMVGQERTKMAEEIEEIEAMFRDGEQVGLEIPDVRPNTARASAHYAALEGTDADDFRRDYFDAVWSGGAVEEQRGTEDSAKATAWQDEWEAFENRMVPLLVSGVEVHRGKDALSRLAELLTPASDG